VNSAESGDDPFDESTMVDDDHATREERMPAAWKKFSKLL
jgi:hypothetical protein